MDPIKEAFTKAKQDIFNLQSQIESLKQGVDEIKRTLQYLITHQTNQQTDKPTQNPTNIPPNPSNSIKNPAIQQIQDYKMPLYGLKNSYNDTSIGNGGVPTDRQTNQQTDTKRDKISHLEKVSNILNSLDSIKKEIRSQFKHLSKQEMAVFSLIYNLEEQGFIVDYSLISQKMSLSESSIRDYVQKIIKKGISLIKTKENNKKVLISIAPELKKIASLDTILMLRQL